MHLAGQCIFIRDRQALIRVLRNRGGATTHIAHPVVGGPAVVLLKILAVGSQVHVEDCRLRTGGVFKRDQRLFRGVHAADLRAVGVATLEAARSDTLDPGYPCGLVAVGRTGNFAVGRPGCRNDPLVLERREDVGKASVAILPT